MSAQRTHLRFSLPLVAALAFTASVGSSCTKKQPPQPRSTGTTTKGSAGRQPPKTRPDCKGACEYFTHCQSPRWTSASEEKELAGRCAQQCAKPDPGQMATFFEGIKDCSVGRSCVAFGDCMKKMLQKLQAQGPGGQPVEDPDAIYNVPAGSSPVRGPVDAPVTIVMFADYECPFCGRGHGIINQVLKAYPGKVRLVYKHYPLPNHRGGKRAAEAAFCVMKASGKAVFWKLHDKLYSSADGFDDKTLLAAAKSVGADVGKVQACMGDPKQLAPLAQDLSLGTNLGVDGTPAFFINGKKLSGAQPLEVFKKEVDAALAKALAAIKSGVKAAEVYQHLTGKGHNKVKLLKGAGGHGPGDGHGHGGPPELDPTVVFQVPVTRNHPARGPRDALVTIVEFADFQCPACAVAGGALKKLAAAFPKDVRVVFRNFPLPMHADAALAAEAALAVRAQKGDKGFFEYHDKLYANRHNLGRPVLEKLAREMGVDIARFKKALDGHTYRAQVDADRKLAETLAVPATPALFINGKVIVGVPSAEELQKLVKQAMAEARKLVAGGTARSALYDTLMKSASPKPVFKKAP